MFFALCYSQILIDYLFQDRTQLFLRNGMRYLKPQIAFLFLLTVNAGWLVGASYGGNRYERKSRPVWEFAQACFDDVDHAFEQASKEGSRPQVNIAYAPNSNPSHNTNCDQSTHNNLVLDWWSQVKMQIMGTLINGVGLPLGIKALETVHGRYERWSDPKGYAKKKAAEKEQEKAQRQLDIDQHRLHGALVREKELAGQHTAMQLIQIQRKEVEGFIAGYEQKIKDAFKQRDEIASTSDIPEAKKREIMQVIQQQVMHYYQTLAGFNETYDKLATLTIVASNMHTPGKLEAFGREMKEQKQPKNKKKSDAKKQQNNNKHHLPQSPYDAIDALLSTELKKVESKLHNDDAELTESSE
jgi:hypothetical protein